MKPKAALKSAKRRVRAMAGRGSSARRQSGRPARTSVTSRAAVMGVSLCFRQAYRGPRGATSCQPASDATLPRMTAATGGVTPPSMTQADPSSDASGKTSSFGFRDVDAKEKVQMVRGVFDSVASNYDLMNDLMSAGVHRIWKDATAAKLNVRPGEVVLDMAGGTGDMARRYSKMARAAQERRGGEDATVIVMDYNAEMILNGVAKGGEPEMAWGVGDAMNLPLPDASIDAYSISFGIRNVADIPQALREARRALKPGGRFICLEFSRPTTGALRKAYDAWSFHAIPRIGQLVAKDRDSYQYLVESIRRFPDQQTFKRMIEEAGFSRVSVTNLSGGIAAIHHGWAI